MVMVEPHGAGMVAFTLRAADEVPALQFASTEVDLDAEMVAIAGAIIKQRTGIRLELETATRRRCGS
jgi:non-homologous end joining protein Ku